MIGFAAALSMIAAGLLPSIAMLGPSPTALVLAPLITALLATVAGFISIVSGGGILPWFVLVVAIANAGGLVYGVRGKRVAWPSLEPRDGLAAVLIVGACALPLLALRRPVVDWDPHMMWLFRARWFYGGGAYVRAATGNPALTYSWPDFPLLVPATVGGVWRVVGRVDLRAGQALIAVLNLGAVSLVGLAFPALAPRRLKLYAAGLGALVGLGAFGFAGIGGTNGYVDLLWAASMTVAVLYLLRSPMTATNTLIGLVGCLVAGLTKNEGMVTALVVLALAEVRRRFKGREAYLLAGGAGLILYWPVVARSLGAKSYLERADISGLVRGDPAVWTRFAPIIRAILPLCLWLLVGAGICSLVGALMLRPARASMRLSSSSWTWVVVVAYLGFVLVAFLTNPEGLTDLYTVMAPGLAVAGNTTVARTLDAVRLLLLADIGLWCLCALGLVMPQRTGAREPGPVVAVNA